MIRFPTAPEQRLGLLVWAALIVLQFVWHGWLCPPTQHITKTTILTITAVPLLLPLMALRNPRRALLWVGMLSLFYFCHGIAENWSSTSERPLALIETALTLLLIGTLGAGAIRKR